MLEVLGKIGFDWQVALANLVNFIIIFFLLRKFAWGPIQKIITERQRKIDQGLEDAKKAETELLMAEEIKKSKVEEGKQEANSIVSSAQEKADAILVSTESEALNLKSSIIKDGERIAEEKKNAVEREVEKELGQLVIKGVEKILQEDMTEEKQKEYITKSLGSFSALKNQ